MQDKELEEKLNEKIHLQGQCTQANSLHQPTLLENLEYEQRHLIQQLAHVQEKIFRLKQNPYLANEVEFLMKPQY